MSEDINNDNIVMSELLPMMPLRNTVVFPHQVVPLAVGREKSLNLLKYLGDNEKIIGLVSQSDGNVEEPLEKENHAVGDQQIHDHWWHDCVRMLIR